MDLAKSCTSKKSPRFSSSIGLVLLQRSWIWLKDIAWSCALFGLQGSPASTTTTTPFTEFDCFQIGHVFFNLPWPHYSLSLTLAHISHSAITTIHSGQLPWIFFGSGDLDQLHTEQAPWQATGGMDTYTSFLIVVKKPILWDDSLWDKEGRWNKPLYFGIYL